MALRCFCIRTLHFFFLFWDWFWGQMSPGYIWMGFNYSLASVWKELCLIRSVAWAPSSGRALNCPLKVLSDLVKDSLNQPLSHFGDVSRQIHLISTTVATKKTIIFPPLPLGRQGQGLYSSVDWINNRWNDTDICRTFCLAEHKHKPDTAI